MAGRMAAQIFLRAVTGTAACRADSVHVRSACFRTDFYQVGGRGLLLCWGRNGKNLSLRLVGQKSSATEHQVRLAATLEVSHHMQRPTRSSC